MGNLLNLCIEQGLVYPECKLDGMMVLLLTREGKNPCIGCNAECPHNKTKASNKRQNTELTEKDERIRKRILNAKPIVIMNIDTDSKSVFINVVDTYKEKMYCARYDSLYDAIMYIPAICHKYEVDQILIDRNGYGTYIYDSIKNKVGDIDIVPATAIGMHL